MVAGLREIMEVDPHSANGVVTARSLQGAQRYAFKLTARPAAKRKEKKHTHPKRAHSLNATAGQCKTTRSRLWADS